MGYKTIKNTINRNGTIYVQFRLPDKKFFKKSLWTDSHKQASVYMAQISPLISLVQSGAMTPDDLKERISILTGASLAVDRVLTEQIVNDEHKLVTRAELDEILYKFLNGDYEEASRIPKIAPIVRKIAGEHVNGKEQAISARAGYDFYTNEYVNGSEGTKALLKAGLQLHGQDVGELEYELQEVAVQVDMHRSLLHRAYEQFYSGDLSGYKQTLDTLRPPEELAAKAIAPKEKSQLANLSLRQAWDDYRREKGASWTLAIDKANERYIEVLLAVLGGDRDVATITKQDIKQVMEAVEGLPKRVVQPYRSMTIEQLLACDDIPEDQLLGTEAIHKHLKIYKSLFKVYLTDDKDVLSKSPTDGVSAPASTARFGAYTNNEMKKFVKYAIARPDGWLKWIILLLAYTGARRSEIAKLTACQIKFDEDSQRHYLLIAEGGQGKTENATRQVPIHDHLIQMGFLEFVEGKKDKLFPAVSGSNMHKIGKTFSDIREELGIPYKDDHNQRRILHSLRHSVVTSSGQWMTNIAHLQQVIGHEKSGSGITQRYMHTFPLASVCYIIDGLNWL